MEAFKDAGAGGACPILKWAQKVKQAMMQPYVLKLLKVQTKYLGKQWQKSNVRTMSAIYQKGVSLAE